MGAAWKIMTRANPRLDNNLYAKIYQRTLPYFSRDLLNVDRDWEKVGQFCKHLGVLETEFDQHWSGPTSSCPRRTPPPRCSPSPRAASASTCRSSTRRCPSRRRRTIRRPESLRVHSDDDAGANSPS